MLNERESTIVLNMVPGIGYARYTSLVLAFGSAANSVGRSVAEYAKVAGIGRQLATELASFPWEEALNNELSACEKGGVRVIAMQDEIYPAVLHRLPDPPLCLYVRGSLPEFPDTAVAIVGSRKISAYGERMARALAADAVAAGFTVVSGLAFGADAVAHAAAVDNGGITVAVLGGGLKNVHPKENIPLARKIVEKGGAVISEFPLDFPVSRTSFPRRNRIVAGLCRGTIVVEAGLESGALITARSAIDNGREVFAVPGHADNAQAKGCHRLIKDGAYLIEDFSDVLTAFGIGFLQNMRPDATAAEDTLEPELREILNLIQNGARTLDTLQTASGLDTGDLSARLLKLELMLRVERMPDQSYRIME